MEASPKYDPHQSSRPHSEGPAEGVTSATALQSAAGGATGTVSAGALTGPPPVRHVDARAPRATDPLVCSIGECSEPATTITVFPGRAGDFLRALCDIHAQELLMELAEKLGVGRRS